MRKTLLLWAALCGPALLAEPAMALDTGHTYTVRFEGLKVGTWRLRNRVEDTGNFCTYTVQWSSRTGGAPLGRTVRCHIDERKASDEFDCERSRRRFFDTIVQKNDCFPCRGFDDFGQQTRINQLIAGESSAGALFGVVSSASIGDVQSLEIM